MTKKDYVLISDVLHDMYQDAATYAFAPAVATTTVIDIMHRLSVRLKADNSAFDSDKFMKAVLKAK